MENQISTYESQNPDLVNKGISEDKWNSIRNTLYPAAGVDSIKLALDYCAARELDVMLKPVHIVPMWDSKRGKMTDTVMPSIGLYRIQAERSGSFGGCLEPEFGEVKIHQGVNYPEWCKFTVRKIVQGVIVDVIAKEYWMENVATKKGGAANAMWAKRPFAQLAKCAEAQALRRGWPELGSLPTAEEMDGKGEVEVNTIATVTDILSIQREAPKEKVNTSTGEVYDAEITEIQAVNVLEDAISSATTMAELNALASDLKNASETDKPRLRELFVAQRATLDFVLES